MTYLEKLWKTKGRLATVKAYFDSMSSIGSSMARATEAVDRMANKGDWGEPAKVEARINA